ncbi:prepilin-type N-terminal cleavage/methylation domain-containing protein [Pseudoduganella lutea]|uniref:Prepilin-type N-terminal cleavage/methylation domain-containing protein n=1 Tax=Pseudoduganella lutea TaxID=321985 RepID=A0A4P6L5Q2_9BURK|nr:prepilin-type N-terminal cleavage/methylation domain-containing protein [Pseudoduganella lutea]QBE66665.1 prepilin-type N-terminal cleavage/methylation domain-containing protein [Pseudoduganella lutea]
MRQRGFTLVELVVVMVVTGVLAAGLVVFFRPALENYAMATRRGTLTDLADGAMRTMMRDVRSAVPNSIRQPNAQCFEVVPTSDGGRLRIAPDIQSGGASKPLDTYQPTTQFDVISPLLAAPVIGDWIVIGNQVPENMYSLASASRISSVAAPPASTSPYALGTWRIGIQTKQFPPGYEGGRFVVVPDAQKAVFYTCQNAGVDANGTGTGTLYRFSGYGFDAAAPTACKVPQADTAVLASRIARCEFTYDPNPGSEQAAGYLQMRLRLSEGGDDVDLLYGAYADNLP